MNKEDYVSFEVAKLLKEKGFNEPCFSQYTKTGSIWNCQAPENFNESEGCYSRPSLYEAQKWLRKQGVFIVITPRYTDKYQIIEYEYRIIQYTDLIDKNRKGKLCYVVYESFEECLNEGILESLKFI